MRIAQKACNHSNVIVQIILIACCSTLMATATTDDVFDVSSKTVLGEQMEMYYIKKQFYTLQNIEEGRKFFEVNCAACHGADADGSGARASIMIDAKPRMLTNLDWINTRDDLRLLRSIKYGVPGTAMTPWGDFTSSLQRLQLVIFIRSLTEEKEQRGTLAEALYQTFSPLTGEIEKARRVEYDSLHALQQQYDVLEGTQKEAEKNLKESAATEIYKQRLELGVKLQQHKVQDERLLSLKKLLEKERDFYQSIGNDLIAGELDGPIWQMLLKMVKANNDRFTFTDNKLVVQASTDNLKPILDLGQQMVEAINTHIIELEQQKKELSGRLPSVDKDNQTQSIAAKIVTDTKLNRKISSGLKEMPTLWQQEQQLTEQINAVISR